MVGDATMRPEVDGAEGLSAGWWVRIVGGDRATLAPDGWGPPGFGWWEAAAGYDRRESMDVEPLAVDPSGLPPVYVDVSGRRARRISELVRPGGSEDTSPAGPGAAREGARWSPDPQAWSEMLAVGAPLVGRTVFSGVARLAPGADPASGASAARGAAATADVSMWSADAPPIGMPPEGWAWFGLPGEDSDGDRPVSVEDALDALLEALRGEIADRLGEGPVDVLLSGGWDSRVLTALLVQESDRPVTAWTTSSDIGHRLDDLVAGEVADHLGLEHRLIEPHPASFLADLHTYARAVEHQTSFHVWLVPLAERLWADPQRCVLDGLGGGIFLDGAFGSVRAPSDRSTGAPSAPPAPAAQIERLVRYSDGVRRVVRADLADPIVSRAEAAVGLVADHVHAHTGSADLAEALTAYLVRTWPGIAAGPYGLVGAGCRVATPFLAPDAVAAAAALPHEIRAGGQVYRRLLERIDPVLAEMPTAAMFASQRRPGRGRTYPRRASSEVSASQVRDRLCAGPVAPLLSPELHHAEVAAWQRLLDRTGPQHVLRSLAVLDDWVQYWSDHLDDPIDRLVEAWSGEPS